MRLFAIGDIHGCADALRRLDRELAFTASDTVVTLGDYVDRGPNSRGVIEFLLELSSRCRLIPLRGNHEIMMLRARDDRAAISQWLSSGGDSTLDSYRASAFTDIPDAHWDFLLSTVPFHETADDFFVHANASPEFSLADQPEQMLFWEFIGEPIPHASGRRMICGHSAQRSGRPLDFGHAVCIDTYAHGGGWLTCLEPRSDAYWQATQKGSLRCDTLR